MHTNTALSLKLYARRRRAQVLKPAAATSAPSVTSRPTKVHFSDASIRRATSSSSPVRISLASSRSRASIPLPTRLERPLFREVDAETLAAASPEMKGLPVDYIRDALETIGARWATLYLLISIAFLTFSKDAFGPCLDSHPAHGYCLFFRTSQGGPSDCLHC